MVNEMFFESLATDIENAKTKKTLAFLSNRLNRFVNDIIINPVSKTYKATVLRGYKASSKLIKAKIKSVI